MNDLKGLEKEVPRAISDSANATAKFTTTAARRQLAAAGGLPVREFGSGDKGSVRPLLGTLDDPAAAIRILNYNISQTHFKNKTLSRNMSGALGLMDVIAPVPNFPFRVPFPTRLWPIFTRNAQPKRLMSKGYYGPGGKWSQLHPGAALPMREPIDKVFNVSPRKIFEGNPAVGESITTIAQEKFDETLDKKIATLIKTGSARGGA